MASARHGRVLALAAGLSLALPPVASAQFAQLAVGTAAPATELGPADKRAAVLPLQIEGDLNPGWRDQILEDLSRGLVQAGMEVVPPEEVIEASGGGGDCKNARCFGFLSSSLEARFLVRAKISVEDRNYSVTIDIIDGNDGSIAASSSEGCELCGLVEVRDLVTKQAAALRQKVDVLSLEPAVVAITSDPSGATIFLDGKEIGSTPLEQQLPAGEHEARAKKAGYLEQTRTLNVVQGVRETLSFELLPDSDPEASKAGRGWKVPVGWSLLGVGIAGLAAGGTFLGLHDNPYRASCSGPDVDEFANCRQLYDTRLHGIILTASGGALLITGMALLIRDRVERGPRAKEVARRLQLGPGTMGMRF